MGKKERTKECGGRVGSVAVCGSWGEWKERGERKKQEKKKKRRENKIIINK